MCTLLYLYSVTTITSAQVHITAKCKSSQIPTDNLYICVFFCAECIEPGAEEQQWFDVEVV